MTEVEYQDYLQVLIPEYARDNIEAGYWEETEALERSRKSVETLLPNGVQTPNHYLYIVADGDRRVGIVWMRATLDTARKSGFIFDLAIDEAQRGNGFGKQTMQLIEAKARELGLASIGLHVFAKNQVARHLYEGMGYETKSMNMTKQLN